MDIIKRIEDRKMVMKYYGGKNPITEIKYHLTESDLEEIKEYLKKLKNNSK